MKRKKVMRLLALAMAASVTVTAQGIPAGLTTVYASGEATDHGTALTASDSLGTGIWKEVTATAEAEDEHLSGCYESGAELASSVNSGEVYSVATSEAADGSTEYTYTKFAATDYVVAAAAKTAYPYIGNNDGTAKQYMPTTSNTDHNVYDVATATQAADATAAFQKAKAATLVNVVYLNKTQADKIVAASSGIQDSDLAAGEGYTALKDNTDSLSAGYYLVEFVKAYDATENDTEKKNSLLALSGAVLITEENKGSNDIVSGASEANLTEGDVYIPKSYKAVGTALDLTDGATATTGSGTGAITWTYVSNGTFWYNSTAAETQPDDLGFEWNNSSSKWEIQTATAAELDSAKEHHIFTLGEGEDEEPIATEKVKLYNGKYYTDVSADYVTAVAVTSGKATATVADSASEEDIDDDVTITKGLGTTTSDTLSKDKVLNDYTTGAEKALVKGFSLSGADDDLVYFADADGDGIVDEGETVKLSTLTTTQAIIDAKLAEEADLTITLKTIASPEITVTGRGGTELTDTGLDGTVYDGDSAVPTFTASATTTTTSGGTSVEWSYSWVDELLDENGEVIDTQTKDISTLSTGTYTPSVAGLHRVYVKATESNSSATASSDKTANVFYVLKNNPATVSVDSTKNYDGTAVTATVTKDDKQDAAPTVNYSYVEKLAEGAEGTPRSGSGLPVEPGTWTVTAKIDADYANGYKATEFTFETTISKDISKTATVTTTVAKDADDAQNATVWTVDLSDAIAEFEDTDADIVLDYEGDSGDLTDNKSVIKSGTLAYDKDEKKLSFSIDSKTNEASPSIVVKLNNSRYTVAVTVNLAVEDAGTKIVDLDLSPITVYYGEYGNTESDQTANDALLAASVGNTDLLSKYLTFTSNSTKINGTNYANFPINVGTHTLDVTYDSTEDGDENVKAKGSASTTLTIKKKPITVTIEDKEVTIGETTKLSSFAYDVTTADDAKAVTVADAGTLTWVVKDSAGNEVDLAKIDLTTPGTYTVTVTSNLNTDKFVFSANTANLVIKKAVSEAPVIEGPDEEFEESAEVTITAAAGATIYYTTEDIELTAENGTKYTGAITLEDTATVKAIAVENGKDASAVVSKTFTKKAAEDNGEDEANPDDGNTDDNNAPDDGSADDNNAPDDGSADDNTANDNTAGDNNANDNSGSDNTGSDANGSGNSGSDANGSDNTGSDANGSGNTGSDANGSGNAGSDANGSGNAGSDANGSGNAGSDNSGSGSTGSDNSGSGSTGSDNSGSGSTGSDASVSTGSGSTAATATAATTTTATGETHIEAAADGTRTIVDASGAVVTSAKVTIGGNDYITDAAGTVVTNALTTTPSGNTVYAGKDGAIVKNKTVTVSGKKYYATKTGKIAKSGFYTTAKGNTVYATKSGQLKASKAFTVNGKKYVAKKSGALYKNTTVTIGNKKYTINKKGVVTKVKTVK
jgi:hypothetical protein